MAEKYGPQSDFDKEFEAMAEVMAEDEAFARRIDDIDDCLDEQMIDALFAPTVETLDPKGPYYVVPVEGELQTIVDSFHAYCRDLGVNPYDAHLPDHVLQMLMEHVMVETYNLSQTLRHGDTVSASSAMVNDFDEATVDYVEREQRIQGEVVGTVVNLMPDDVSGVTLNESGEVPLGVGLMIENPVILDGAGTREPLYDTPKAIVIALGTLGLKVDKHFYRSEELFTMPPDEQTDH